MLRPMAIIALTLAVVGLPACGGGEHAPEAKAGEPIAVTVVPVRAIDTTERLEAGGWPAISGGI